MDMLQQQKLDAMKELAYGASHEINNPLANISARAQTLLRDESHPDRRRALEAIQHQAMRAHEMISDLMLFARPPRIEAEAIDLCCLLDKVSKSLAERCRRNDIQLVMDVPTSPVEIQGDQRQMTVALQSVITNAIEAIGQNGDINVCLTEENPDLSDGVAIVTVKDSGPGVSEDVLPHIFDPFFSGREAGRGLGFGLSKCWRIVTDHGGSVTVDSDTEVGTKFTLELPLADQNSVRHSETTRDASL